VLTEKNCIRNFEEKPRDRHRKKEREREKEYHTVQKAPRFVAHQR